jgi:hypothetical protein
MSAETDRSVGASAPARGSSARPSPPPPPMSTRGMVVGTILLGLLLLGFALWANEAGKRAGATAPGIPQIELLAPVDGDVVQGPVLLEFQTDVRLQRGPSGWESGGLHIHAEVDGRELMPGASDIERLDGNRYRWTMRPLEPGTREVRLFWSDRMHRPIPAGASPTVRVQAR